MDLLIVIMLVLLLIIFISPAKVRFEGDDLIFSIPLLFMEKRKKKNELESYQVKVSAFPIILRFKDGTVYRWTSFPQWRSVETLSILEEITRKDKA